MAAIKLNSVNTIHNDSKGISEEHFEVLFCDFYPKLVDQLPDDRREVFKLVYFEGYKTKEIASRLDMPQRTVECHVYLTLKF